MIYRLIDLLRVGRMTWFEITLLHVENLVGTGNTAVPDLAKIRYSIRNIGLLFKNDLSGTLMLLSTSSDVYQAILYIQYMFFS
jgi:hypothetical protein